MIAERNVVMYRISIDEYPTNKKWQDKSFHTPHVPGGKDNLLDNLRILLLAIKNHEDINSCPEVINSKSKQTLEGFCVHVLGPVNLVRRTADYWELTPVAEKWLDSEDDMYLAAYFSSTVKFFAEILYYLDTPKKSNELFDIAVNEYDLAWKVNTTINNRLIWLRQFELIDFQSFSLLYCITDKGREFLKNVELTLPDEISKSQDSTINETEIDIPSIYLDYYKESYPQHQRTTIGYMPGKPEEIDETTLNCLKYISENNNRNEILNYFTSEYGLSESSVSSMLKSLSSWGLIDRKTDLIFVLTDIGRVWMESPALLYLLVMFHLRSLFVFDILSLLREESLSVKELAVRAKVSYGFERENSAEIRNRLAILRKSGLIRTISADRYTITNRGCLLIDTYGEILNITKHDEKKQEILATSTAVNILTDLRLASKDSFNPDKFEKIASDYFKAIGFESEWIGGSGNTDVLIKSGGSQLNSYIVTVDAKSTSSSSVTDSLVDFDTLKEHKKKHKADYIAIVGCAFDSERLIKRAQEHGVVLLDLNTLEELYNIQLKTPLKLSSYRKIFEQSGKADLSVLTDEINALDSSAVLIHQIMECLIKESVDPVTKGMLTVRDLYLALRSKLDMTIKVEDIEQTLFLLSSPLIACVEKNKEYYYAIGTLNDTSRALRFLSDSCAELPK